MTDLNHGAQAAAIEQKLAAGAALNALEQQILITWYRNSATYFLAIGADEIAAVFGRKHDGARERFALNRRNGV